MTYIELFGGLVYLLLGGDLLVRGSVALARRWRLSPWLVGATIVAIGTSTPELFVSVEAALTGHPGIAMGNVVGSNIANVLLVTGALAVICPIASDDSSIRGDTIVMLLVSGLLFVLCLGDSVARFEGAILLVGLVLFLGLKARGADRTEPVRHGRIDWVLGLPSDLRMIGFFIVAGLVGLPLGANLLIEAAAEIALEFGVSEAVVGLTVVAVGTSLPELATVFVAASRRQVDVALGNVIGSNVLNVLAIMGAAAVLSPSGLPVPERFLTLDLPVMVASALPIAAFAMWKRPIGRVTGVILLFGYSAYVVALYGMA